MNQELLHKRAEELDQVLKRYEGTVPDAAYLRIALKDMLPAALAGTLATPATDRPFPGQMLFIHGTLASLVDLANAFALFRTEAEGGPSDGLKAFRARHGDDPLTGEPKS